MTALRDRLARQLGADADTARGQTMGPLLDQLEDRNAALNLDNNRLRHQVTALQDEVRELADTLDASRAMNRELMSDLNREPPTRAPIVVDITPPRPPNRPPSKTV